MSRGVIIGVGHLGWTRKIGGLTVYGGNDPKQAEREPLFDEVNLREAEGATVVVVVLPGRFADAEYVERVTKAVAGAAMSVAVEEDA